MSEKSGLIGRWKEMRVCPRGWDLGELAAKLVFFDLFIGAHS